MTILGLALVAALLAGLQAVLFSALGLRALRYRRYFTRPAVYEGERVEMVEELANAKLLPVPWLRVEARMSPFLRFKRQENLEVTGEAYHRSLFAMAPWRKITRTHGVECLHRGHYEIDSVSLTCGDLLGFNHRSATLQNPMELFVYPRILDFSALSVPSRRWQGDVVVRRFIEPDPFLVNGIRPFLPGDMPRDVHWAATARTGALQVKTRDYTASPRLLLILNVQLSENQWGELNEAEAARVEGSISLAATYAEWASKNGVEIGLMCNGRWSPMDDRAVEVPLGGGVVHLTEMLEALARLKVLRRRSFPQYLDDEVISRGITGTDILMISHYWSPMLEERAGRLRRADNSVTWINPEGGALHG
jgi:uncharacterized protein (DUF58 family)